MTVLTTYHLASGAVLGTQTVPDGYDYSALNTPGDTLHVPRMVDVELYCSMSGLWMCAQDVDAATEYVTSPTTKSARTVATGVVAPAYARTGEEVTVSGLPSPCWARVDGALRELTDSALTFTPAQERTYTLELVGAWRGTYSVTAETAVTDSLRNDPRWQVLQNATPQQIEDWLTANVTSLASARQVLKVLLLAVRKLGA